jgi:hypothetical protein
VITLRFSDLWTWRGTLDRGPYAVWLVLLLVAKGLLDRALLAGWTWSWYAWFRGGPLLAVAQDIPPGTLALLALAGLPFIAAGTALTVRRLRSAGLHPVFCVCLFLPFVKVVLAAMLMLLPAAAAPADPGRPDRLGRFIPRGRRSALVALLFTTLVGTAAIAGWTHGLRSYGWGLFLGLPFILGLSSSLLHGYHEPRRLGECLLLGLIATGALGLALLLLALEGLICIAMASPLLGGMVLLGSFTGWVVQREYWNARNRNRSLAASLLLIPGTMGTEHLLPPVSPLYEVRTAIEIAAPPAAVWKRVVDFPQLDEPEEWIFRTGLAYPVRATIDGCGTGALRRCTFNTGDFVEPITVWDEPRLLAFAVTENPPPMREWSFYEHVDAPHLHGFMVSERGQFRLIDLGNGRTRLEGTTWYRHGLQPAGYWRLWSDEIIHRIHLRVLEHVKRLAE